MRRSRIVVFLVTLTLLGSTGHAKDLCFNSTSPPNPAPSTDPDILIVAQGLKVPGKGKCKAASGIEIGYFNQARHRLVSGTVCLNSAGTTLHASFLVHATLTSLGPFFDSASPLHVTMTVPYPALTGGAIVIESSTAQIYRQDVIVGACGTTIPVL